MTFSRIDSEKRAFLVRRLPTPAQFEAALLPVSKFPIPGEELEVVHGFVKRLSAKAREMEGISSDVYMQFEQMVNDESRKRFSESARAWMPKPGLGVWPDRKPPTPWTKEELDDVGPGQKLRPLMFQVFRVSTAMATRLAARDKMFDLGSVIEIINPDTERYLKEVSAVLKAPITSRSYSFFPYYLPLLEERTITTANERQLNSWLPKVGVYIRESFEDTGVLIISAGLKASLLDLLGGESVESGWSFKIAS